MSDGRRRAHPGAAMMAATLTVVVVAGCVTTSSPGTAPATAPPSVPAAGGGPPPAWLETGPDGLTPGVSGSWTRDGAGSDVPWLPASALALVTVGPGSRLVVGLGDGLRIGSWRADVAPASDPTGVTARWWAGRDVAGPPLARVAFDSPGAGSWVLRVMLASADGRGDAAYSWALDVSGSDEPGPGDPAARGRPPARR
jgi:hypothetical protein